MKKALGFGAAVAVCVSGGYLAFAQGAAPAPAAQPFSKDGNFFITSAGPGNGADLGGLAGADAHCQKLAAAVGAGDRMWRAFLSTDPTPGKPGIDAVSRVANVKLPIMNARGVVIARTLADFVSPQNAAFSKQNALNELGAIVHGRGDPVNTHDMMTGSTRTGTSFGDTADHTCSNYTNSRDSGTVQLGHHDRSGPQQDQSQISIHASSGCSQPALVSTGGAGLFYCLAVPMQ